MNWKTRLTRLSFFRTAANRRAVIVVAQLALALLAWLSAFALRYEFRIPGDALLRFIETLPYLLLIRLAVFHRFQLHRDFWHHVGLQDLIQLVAATSIGSMLFPIGLALVNQLHGISISVFVFDWMLTIAFIGGARVVARYLHERTHMPSQPRGLRTLVVGAGEAADRLVRQILRDPRSPIDVIGFVDDDPAKAGRSLHGLPVLGTTAQLRGLVPLHRAARVLIAIPSATTEQLRRLVERATESGAEVKLLPRIEDIVSNDVRLDQVRDVEIEDLLGREPVNLDLSPVEPILAGRVVLVTGAGGSIGSELARQIARFHPLRLVLLERAESPLYFTHLEVQKEAPGTEVVPVLASVTNLERLQHIFERYRPDVVFHAAAYKHVPMLERNMVEGVWNNVIGTLRLARCAAAAGVSRFVLISTDKAVRPTSVLGATKLIAERIVLDLPSLRAASTDFRVVRFGNVLGSDGSVVPLFKRQIAEGGPVTVTHADVRRYFMTIREAVQLVLQASALPEAAGRIALLEMGTQVRILDLAEQLIRLSGLVPHKDVKIVFTGLRAGEKLHEELLSEGEQAKPTSIDKIRVVERSGINGDAAALARRLRRLRAVTARRDEDAIVRALAALVPEYQPVSLRPGLRVTPSTNGRHHARIRPATRRARAPRNLNGTNGTNGANGAAPVPIQRSASGGHA